MCAELLLSAAFLLTDFGAKSDGSNCRTAFAMAIDAAAEKGGQVVVPAGTWTTGAIQLKSNVELHLADGACVVHTDDPEDYLPPVKTAWEGTDCVNYSPLVYAFGATNVAITGRGTFRPRLDAWKLWQERTPAHLAALKQLYAWGVKGTPWEERDVTRLADAHLRPHFLQLVECRNVRLEDFTVEGSPFWILHLLRCREVGVRRVTDRTLDTHNNDGIDIDMCQDVTVEDCTFDAGDDVICIKSGRDADGRRHACPSERIAIRRCTSVGRLGHGFVSFGSELSGGIRDVTVEDCTVSGRVERLVFVKTGPSRGGFVENVRVSNLKVREAYRIFALKTDYPPQWKEFNVKAEPTRVSGITISDVDCEVADAGFELRGSAACPAKDLTVRDLRIGALRGKLVCAVENAELKTERVEATDGFSTICEPLDLCCRPQSGADAPTWAKLDANVWLVWPARGGGYWSEDLVKWTFVPTPIVPIDVRKGGQPLARPFQDKFGNSWQFVTNDSPAGISLRPAVRGLVPGPVVVPQMRTLSPEDYSPDWAPVAAADVRETVDFRHPVELTAVQMELAAGERRPLAYRIEGSADGRAWTTLVDESRPDTPDRLHAYFQLPKPTRVRLVRVVGLGAPSAGASASRFRCWMSPPAAIVADGKVCGEIVVPRKDVHAAEEYAAEELQKWIGELTGAYVPVVFEAQTNAAASVRVWVGAEFARRRFPADIQAIGASDGYAVRTVVREGVRNVYVFGAVPRGTLHAAYQLIYRNSDIIWARPDPLIGTVYGKSGSFAVKEANFVSVPKSVTRSWQWNYHGPDHEKEWESRNLMNRIVEDPASKFAPCFVSGGHGHGIQHYIGRGENVKAHPDWYPLVGGQRVPQCGQICFTAYDMIPTYVSNMVSEIRATYPNKRPHQVKIDWFNLSCADNWTCCECPRCMQPFVCENGKTVTKEADNFRSAQCFTFLNKVAREIRKTYPQVKVATYAYEFTLPVPPFPLEPNVCVEYCPYGLNEKAPIYDDDTNSAWHRYLDDWCSVCAGVWVRMYLGWANTFPRSLEYPVRDNGLYYQKLRHPVAHFSSEHPVDWDTKLQPAVQIWDVSGMTAWCICRMWWDPTQDLEAIRTDYCRRAYREAWEPMKAWHDGMHAAFFADKMPTTYNSGDPLLYTAQYVVKPGLADTFGGYLKDALARARHPVSKELIRRQLAHFESWVAQAKVAPPKRLTVRLAAKADAATDFASPDWERAESTGDFVVCADSDAVAPQGSPAQFRSTAKLLHDGENLIVRFDCWAPDMDRLPVCEKSADGVEKVPRGDIMEFYVGSGAKGKYYQWMIDAGHPDDPSKDLVYDACGFDNSWSGKWTKVNRRYDDHWSVIMKIPFVDVGISAVQTGKTLFQGIRGKNYVWKDPKTGKSVDTREMASWNGGYVHQMQNFGELVLELK